MNKDLLKKLLPHLLAVVIFLIASVLLCRPAFEKDVVMNQHDLVSAKAMSHQSYTYNEKNGHFPLWSVSMFSGMPAFQIIMAGPSTPLSYIDKVFQLGLPEPANYFFLACICFYILCLCAGIKPWVGILGSLGFAFSTYNPSIISVGHVTKMLAIAYAPAVLGGVILLFRKKYLAGFVLTSLFAFLHISQNHQQITYYLLIIIAFMTVSNFIFSIREKEIGLWLKSTGLAITAGALGLIANAIILFPVYDYVKYSKRGGQLILEQGKNQAVNNKVVNNKSTGLTKEYAFQWSYGVTESMSLLFPAVNGYGAHYAQRDGDQHIFPKLDEKSNLADYLTGKLNVPEEQASNIALQYSTNVYWGDQPFLDAPFYIGAAICFLFVLSMFFLDNKYRWWLLGASAFGIMLSWGKNFPILNYFLFDYLPFYNKFRAPSMALFIPQFLFPFAGALAVEKLVSGNKEELWPKFRKSVIAMGAIFAIAAICYFSFDYTNQNKQWKTAFNQVFVSNDPALRAKLDSINQLYQPTSDNRMYLNVALQSKGDMQIANGFLTSIEKDRAKIFGKNILGALLLTVLAAGLIFLFIRNKIKTPFLLVGLSLLVYFDLFTIDSKYLNSFNFESGDTHESNAFPLTAADQAILADKDPNFRVYNATVGDPFQDSHTSWYHKSVGGYHPAKLGTYDDLITYQLSASQNMNVLNMLNTKYFIQDGANQQPKVLQNPMALGNCWFVKGVKWVKGPAEEMKAMDSFNPKDTAIIDVSFKNDAANFSAADSAEYIKQTVFDNDSIQYESKANGNRLAVFSEIFYKDWNAYIDGKKIPVIKANYVLRALAIPAGTHKVLFKFEPKVYNLSYKISNILGWLLSAMLALAAIYYLFPQMRRNKKEVNVKQ